MKDLCLTLQEIFQILSFFPNLDVGGCPVKVENFQITTPIGDVTPILFHQKSTLKNEIVDFDLLKNLLTVLEKDNSMVRLNHIGFGYRVKSQQLERQRLIKLARETDLYLYEEASNDFGLWLFLGDIGVWENPLVEFVPVEVDDPQIDYYLPHIQIDIDTTLNASEIENKVKEIFYNTIVPRRIVIIDGITYIVRSRLGVIDGVNIFLDLATNARNVKFWRQNILKKIS